MENQSSTNQPTPESCLLLSPTNCDIITRWLNLELRSEPWTEEKFGKVVQVTFAYTQAGRREEEMERGAYM